MSRTGPSLKVLEALLSSQGASAQNKTGSVIAFFANVQRVSLIELFMTLTLEPVKATKCSALVKNTFITVAIVIILDRKQENRQNLIFTADTSQVWFFKNH